MTRVTSNLGNAVTAHKYTATWSVNEY